jgi:proteasome lid subunit RPN8/RPN11
VLWDYRQVLGGVVHTHPWEGPTEPSQTDVTTFAAVEQGLGKRLIWPIATMTNVNYFSYNENFSEYLEIQHVPFRDNTGWMQAIIELRQKSQGELS